MSTNCSEQMTGFAHEQKYGGYDKSTHGLKVDNKSRSVFFGCSLGHWRFGLGLTVMLLGFFLNTSFVMLLGSPFHTPLLLL